MNPLPHRQKARTAGILGFVLLSLSTTGCGFRGDPDGSGTIECTQVQIAPQVGGRLLELRPHEGTVLAQGEVVARIDDADYVLRLQEARAAWAQAQAQLDLVTAGSRDEDIRRARAQVSEARASVTAATADVQRVASVFMKGSATPKQIDDARSNANRSLAALEASEAHLAKMEAGSRSQEKRLAQAQLDQAQARLAIAEKAVTDCTVTSPIPGVVTTRVREPGEVVAPGSTLLTVSNLQDAWLSIYVPETRLAQVRLGLPARVRVDGDRKTHTGTVSFVSSVAEFTPRNIQTPDERAKLVYRVKISVPNPDGLFKPGMPADGYLDTAP
jgi:HlyD family secretion protein